MMQPRQHNQNVNKYSTKTLKSAENVCALPEPAECCRREAMPVVT